MPHHSFVIGQRWISRNEPELGLGIIASVNHRFVTLSFPTRNVSRQYSTASAPLQRILFRAGDTVRDCENGVHRVTAVIAGDVAVYECGEHRLSESRLSDAMALTSPLMRLRSGVVDSAEDFALRMEVHEWQASIRRSAARGFAGGRIELIPHQLFIADAVASRRLPRALLADETGLGKTIEACLILHRLLAVERVTRALILVPPALVHQWFVELLRRFNIICKIWDESLSDKEGFPENPFLEDQAGISSISLLVNNEKLRRFALDAGWDMVIVDEAHHVLPDTPAHELLRQLAASSEGFLLLTATPEQLGRRGHFMRLQLLDPARYAVFEEFEEETRRLLAVSARIDAGGEGDGTLTKEQLLDRFGVGRVMFRNTRHTVKGFPERTVSIERLDAAGEARIAWLVSLMKKLVDDKILVICSGKEAVVSLQALVQKKLGHDIAVFHGGMTLIQRDRSAAWFSEEEGANVLICDESGSEGRNFQFCHHLVIYDLPREPEILEQQIGRLDRIGQGSVITIHVPYVANTPQELLCRWYAGLDCFARNVPAAGRVYDAMASELSTLLARCETGVVDEKETADFIGRSQKLCARLARRLQDGRNRLLELSSHRPDDAAQVIAAIIAFEDTRLASFADRLFTHFGLGLEDAGNGTYHLVTDHLTDPVFPLPRKDNPLVTWERNTALRREDIEFLSIDHPMVLGAMDLLLSSDKGSTSFAHWPDATKQIIVEAVFVIECLAPTALVAGRFLPAEPLRVLVNNAGEEVALSRAELQSLCRPADAGRVLSVARIVDEVIPRTVDAGIRYAENKSAEIIGRAVEAMQKTYEEEISRLRYLASVNKAVPDGEIAAVCAERDALNAHLAAARLRLDALRVIWRGPAL
ncbi:MAG: SNF2-related protein [Chitinispirillaceae bacterium]|jgi:ATP-dependent helicase HepA|nr:SNF2-related protein [Chitinispirillaceae bacterium]